jgi:phage I-like protein
MPWETTENEIRHRLRPPEEFEPESFRQIGLKGDKPRVYAIIGRLKGETKTTAQALRFPVEDGWTMDGAKAWVTDEYREHDAEAMSEHPRVVVTLGTIQFSETSELVRIPLAKLGRWVKGMQKFAITRDDLAAMIENFRRRGNGEVVIDYEHASEQPEIAQGQPIPAAGWVRKIEPEPDRDGLIWGWAAFTERARDLIARAEYKYLSPVIKWGLRHKATGETLGALLSSVALVNRPFFDMLPAVTLSEDGWVAEIATERRKKTMAVKQVVLSDRATGKARVVMEDGSEVTLSVEGLTPEPKVIGMSDVKRDKDGAFDFASLPQEQGTLIAAEVFRAMEAQRELDAAQKEGKILPAQRAQFETLALSDLAGFRALMKTMKPQIDLSERGFAGSGDGGADLKTIDARIAQLTREKVAADAKLGYGAAMKIVLSEHPELAARRKELMRE